MPGPDRRSVRDKVRDFAAEGRYKQNPLLAAQQRAKFKADTLKSLAGSAAAEGATPDAKNDGKNAAKKAKAGPQLDGEGKPYITLAQLIKKLTLAPTGGAAKHVVRAGGFIVNGEPEIRPGRKLHHGDKVIAGGKTVTVTLDD